MSFLARSVVKRLRPALARQKSVLPLGLRQTGKTTLLQQVQPDTLLNFLRPEVRLRYERSPSCAPRRWRRGPGRRATAGR